MKLNRHNYEEYFILYLDNELSSEERREVEIFAGDNPDLKAELDILLQTRLAPDTTITYSNKETLMARNSSSINMNNYEEWLLSYIDNELTEQEIKDVEKFVAGHSAAKKELELFQKTKLQPEAIAFPDKESLYRKEEKAKVVAIRWWRIAAAAVLLIGISTTAIVLLNNKPRRGDIASEKTQTVKPTDNSPVKPSVNESPVEVQAIANTEPKKDEQSTKEPVTRGEAKNKKNKPTPSQVKPEENIIAKTEGDKKGGNNLPTPDHNPNVDPKQEEIIVDANPKGSLTDSDNKTDIATVTPQRDNTSNISEDGSGKTTDNPDADFASNDGSKNKYRGFFRKITRTFEKRTNIKATDEDDSRLLIAGLAIKLN
ncbi:MAG TPA: hypothetical protein VIZ28_15990 [Chitinophagaceae bacterium]